MGWQVRERLQVKASTAKVRESGDFQGIESKKQRFIVRLQNTDTEHQRWTVVLCLEISAVISTKVAVIFFSCFFIISHLF